MYEDRGLNSTADVRILTRLLLAGLVTLLLTALVLLIVTGNWIYGSLLVIPYAIVASSQWYAAYKRAQAHGAAGEF